MQPTEHKTRLTLAFNHKAMSSTNQLNYEDSAHLTNNILKPIHKKVNLKSHHNIASLPGNIMRLTGKAGARILSSLAGKPEKNLAGYITSLLEDIEKKRGINPHFVNETDPGLQIPAKKEDLLRGIINQRVQRIGSCEDVSLIMVRLQQINDAVKLIITGISSSPCEALIRPAAGFQKLQRRIEQMGGHFSHNYDGPGGALEVTMPL